MAAPPLTPGCIQPMCSRHALWPTVPSRALMGTVNHQLTPYGMSTLPSPAGVWSYLSIGEARMQRISSKAPINSLCLLPTSRACPHELARCDNISFALFLRVNTLPNKCLIIFHCRVPSRLTSNSFITGRHSPGGSERLRAVSAVPKTAPSHSLVGGGVAFAFSVR